MKLSRSAAGPWLASGELTFATAAESWQPLLDCLTGQPVQLDLSGLSRVDSAGLACLIAWLGEARVRQTAVQMLAAPEQLLQLARVSGVDTVLPLQWPGPAAVNG